MKSIKPKRRASLKSLIDKTERKAIAEMMDDFATILAKSKNAKTDVTEEDVRSAVKAVEKRHPKAPSLRTLIVLWTSLQKLVFCEVARKKVVKPVNEHIAANWENKTKH